MNVPRDEALLLAELLPTACEVGIRNGHVSPGDIVVVVGAGPVGLASVIIARLYSPGGSSGSRNCRAHVRPCAPFHPHPVRTPERFWRGTVEDRRRGPCGSHGDAGRAKEDVMNHPVLVGIDGSAHSSAAADWAGREAALRDVPLRLFHASPPLPGATVPGPALDRLKHMGTRVLRQVADALGDLHPDVEVRAEQTDDAPPEALLAAARDAELLVVGTRGTGGFDGLAVGSVALRMAAAAPCPVVLIPHRPGPFREVMHAARGVSPVVVGFDAHHPVGEAADFAFSAAEARGALLRVVQAWAFPAEAVSPQTLVVTEEDRATWEDQEVLRLSDAVCAWQEKHPRVTARTDVVLLHPAEALLNASRSADLLVVGRRTDPQGAEGRLGPVTHAVLHHARCPVAVVPHAG